MMLVGMKLREHRHALTKLWKQNLVFYLLENVALLEWGEEVGHTKLGVAVPWNHSYLCGEPLTIVNTRDGSAVIISQYQVNFIFLVYRMIWIDVVHFLIRTFFSYNHFILILSYATVQAATIYTVLVQLFIAGHISTRKYCLDWWYHFYFLEFWRMVWYFYITVIPMTGTMILKVNSLSLHLINISD